MLTVATPHLLLAFTECLLSAVANNFLLKWPDLSHGHFYFLDTRHHTAITGIDLLA
jgi:hypothetical protein